MKTRCTVCEAPCTKPTNLHEPCWGAVIVREVDDTGRLAHRCEGHARELYVYQTGSARDLFS